MTGTTSVTFMDPGKPLSPAEVDMQLTRLNNELEASVKALEDARDQELTCLSAYSRAKFKLLNRSDCPVPLSNRNITNTHREDWVNSQILDLYLDLRRAEAARWNARDYMEQLQTQVSLLQSIGKSARQALEIGGGRRW